jgi:hypothetical protein
VNLWHSHEKVPDDVPTPSLAAISSLFIPFGLRYSSSILANRDSRAGGFCGCDRAMREASQAS